LSALTAWHGAPAGGDVTRLARSGHELNDVPGHRLRHQPPVSAMLTGRQQSRRPDNEVHLFDITSS
jgi:hypothetical protein